MSKSQTKVNQLKWLADSIINELEKPDDEIDWEFIEICEDLTKIFMGEKQLSEEDISSRIRMITERRKKFKAVKTKRQIKSILVATVAAVIFIFLSITVYAMTPIGDYIIKVFQFGTEQDTSEDKIDYTYNDLTDEDINSAEFNNKKQNNEKH